MTHRRNQLSAREITSIKGYWEAPDQSVTTAGLGSIATHATTVETAQLPADANQPEHTTPVESHQDKV